MFTSTQQPEGEPHLAVLENDRSSPIGDYDRCDAPTTRGRVTVAVNDATRHGRNSGNGHGSDTGATTPPRVTLRVAPRRGRLAALAAVAVAVIVTLTLVFARGLELSQFEPRDKDDAARTRLLDDYNSYSGSIASALGKPLELFVALAAQLVVLRFLAASATRATPGATVAATTLALSAGMGFLLSNSFNALNVQLRPLAVAPAIGASDLATPLRAGGLSDTLANATMARTTTVSRSVPETTARNLLSNTMLRNLVLPAEPRGETTCDLGSFSVFRDHSVEFGFPAREWQGRALQEAVAPAKTASTLRMVVDATGNNATGSNAAAVGTLPMNASIAAHLFTYSMFIAAGAQSLFPWGNANGFARVRDVKRRVNWTETTKNVVGPTVEIMGLLPTNHTQLSETAQRDFFVRELREAVARQFTNATNTSRDAIALEFSQTPLAPGVVFDALTIEVEMDPQQLTSATNDTRDTRDTDPRFTFVETIDARGAVPGLALFPKAPYRGRSFHFGDAAVYDTPPQVHAMAACLDAENGTEMLSTTIGTIDDPAKWTTFCPNRSNTSFYVFSVAKKLVADSFVAPTPGTTTAAATNVRKIYSFTMGRVSWQPYDLAAAFHASCHAGDTSSSPCHGLALPLAPALGASVPDRAPQQLVVGVDALPVATLPSFYEFRSFRSQMLVQLNEPRQLDADVEPLNGPSPLAGDPLLVHNIAALDWQWAPTTECTDVTETRLQQLLDNHYYSEQSLQPAYTAAAFFLFQNAVVRDTIALDDGRASLAFDANSQPLAVWISVPKQNAWLTLGGCGLLVLALLATLVRSWQLARPDATDPLAAIRDPHAIARVMLDERQFPPALLHRRVEIDDDTVAMARPVELFAIDGLALQHGASKA